jgi:hypothetical protein
MYQALAADHGLNITKYDAWNDTVLGMDENARKVLFFKNREGGEQPQLIAFDNVTSCKKINVSRSVKTNSGVSNVIDQLGLELNLKEGPPVLFEFFNSKSSFNLVNDLELTEKWWKIINDQVKR